MDRVIALIDGFNYYHRIQDHFEATKENLKWTNYWSLAEELLKDEMKLQQVRFYTAIPQYLGKDKQKRHRLFLRASKEYIKNQQGNDFDWIEGNFKRRKKKCLADCKKKFDTWEEKETDVNIAIDLIDLAYQDAFDTCFLFSADTDLSSAVRLHKKRFSNKKRVIIVLPPGAGKADALKDVYGDFEQLGFELFRKNQLPDVIQVKGTERSIENPYN